MKIHIVPDMVEMVTAKDSQKKVSEIDYRLHLHEWICHPDLQVNSHVRKVTDQISDVSPLLMKVLLPSPTPCPPPHRLKKDGLTWFFSSALFQNHLPVHSGVCQEFELSLEAGLCMLKSAEHPWPQGIMSCFSFCKVILGLERVCVFGVKVPVKFSCSDPLHLLQPPDCVQG